MAKKLSKYGRPSTRKTQSMKNSEYLLELVKSMYNITDEDMEKGEEHIKAKIRESKLKDILD